jgi:hypothetical protein
MVEQDLIRLGGHLHGKALARKILQGLDAAFLTYDHDLTAL